MQKPTKRKNKTGRKQSVNYYPAFINLTGKKVIVVGGGSVAERKASSLIRARALVTVISPALTTRLLAFKEKKLIRHIRRSFRKGDLKDCILVIAATDDPSVNSQIAAEAQCLVNVADMPEASSFIVPSVVQRGLLTIAVSTCGASPALAKTIRKELEALYGMEIGRYLQYVSSIRKRVMMSVQDKKKREIFLKSLASEKTLRKIRTVGASAVMDQTSSDLEKLISRSS